MKKTSRKIVLFGNERLATGVSTTAPTLRALIKNGYEVATVVVNQDKALSRSARVPEIEEVAAKHGIEVLSPKRLQDIRPELQKCRASVGVLAAFGKMLPDEFIDLFPKGIINIHPSLLPLYRGPTPIEQAILDGATKTGVSLMQLVKDMDAGPVFGQIELNLKGNESKQELANKLLGLGSQLVIKYLPRILEGKAASVPQDNSRASYCALITKADGLINWQKAATQLEREIRGFLGWPGSYTQLADKEVIITKVKVVKKSGTAGSILTDKRRLTIGCGQDALQIERLKPAGKKEMSTQEFLAGYKNRLKN